MPTQAANGVDLYYEAYGTGTTLLGIHGTPSSAVLWQDAAQTLGRVGRCVVYDRRGFGRSPAPEPFESVDLSDHVEDAAALLNALTAASAVVVGRSTGGLIALELARRHPELVHALVLLEPAMFSMDPDATAWAARMRREVLRLGARDPGQAAEFVMRQALGDSGWESLPEALQQLFLAAGPAVVAEARGRGLDLSEHGLELQDEDLAALTLPTLLVSAEDSPGELRRINARLAERLPTAEEASVGGGHLIDPAHPRVVDFVSRHVQTAG